MPFSVDDLPATGRAVSRDLAVAAIAAACIAPPVAVIDRAVVEQIVHGRPLVAGLRTHGASLRRPLRLLFSRPGGIVWTLYASTYAVANGSETLAQRLSAAPTGTGTLAATMIVNVPLGVWKDIRFAQIYGSPTVGREAVQVAVHSKVSVAATSTFLLRDGITLFGAFVVAPRMAAVVPDHIAGSDHSKAAVAQIAIPILSQLVATPLHLLAISLQSGPHRGLAQRLADIRRDLPVATVVRCIRIIPAFSLGCLLNAELRAFASTLEPASSGYSTLVPEGRLGSE